MSQGGGEGSSGGGRPPILRPGDSNEWVERLQRRLIGRGYVDLEPNGIFDPYTKDILDRYLEARGLAARGMVDGDTWTILED